MKSNDSSIIDKTLPEIFGKEYAEVFLTNWLAYILEINPFVINAFLGEGEENIDFSKIPYIVTVDKRINNSEKERKFIDLFIEFEGYIIAIENKVLTGLSGDDQLKNYNEGIKQYVKDKDRNIRVEKVLLLPSFNKTKPDNGFRVLHYSNISEYIEKHRKKDNNFDKGSTVRNYHLDSFVSHIEKNLSKDLNVKALGALYKEEINLKEFGDESEYKKKREGLLAKLSQEYIINQIEEKNVLVNGENWKTARLNSYRQDYVLFYESKNFSDRGIYTYSAIHYELKYGKTTKDSPLSNEADVRIDFELKPIGGKYSKELAKEFLVLASEKYKEVNGKDQGQLSTPKLDDDNKHSIIVTESLNINYDSMEKLKESLDNIVTTLNKVVSVYNDIFERFIKDNNLI